MESDTEQQKNISTVVVIEDDSLIIDLVRMKLQEHHIETKILMDGAEAIANISDIKPDVVVLDLMLPGKSGEEILEEMKRSPDIQDIPVIVFTNKNREENEAHLLELGADKYLVKATTDLKDLVTEIETLAH